MVSMPSAASQTEAASSHCTAFDNHVRRRLDAARRALELAVQPDCRWFELAELRWKAISSSFCRVDQIDATTEDLTIRSEPVVVLDFVRSANWPAATQWEPAFLRDHHPERQAALSVGEASGEEVLVLLSDMLAYCLDEAPARDATPFYLWDPRFGERAPGLLDGYRAPSDLIPEPDLMALMGSERPPYRWLAVGATGSGCDVHQDPINTCAWNVLVHGWKRWALIHPSLSVEDVWAHDLDDDAATALWFLERLPSIAQKHGARVLVVDQPPGSLLYVPVGWWHATWCLSPVSVAITHNVVTWTRFSSTWEGLMRESGRGVAGLDPTGNAEVGQEDVDPGDLLAKLTAAYGLVDAEQAGRWLSEISRYAADHGLEQPMGMARVASSLMS